MPTMTQREQTKHTVVVALPENVKPGHTPAIDGDYVGDDR